MRVAAARDDFSPPTATSTSFHLGPLELLIGSVAVILMAALAAVVFVPGSNEPTSAALVKATATDMGVSCVSLAKPTPVELELSAFANENLSLRGRVTGSSFCLGSEVAITAITLKPGTNPLDEITESLTQVDVFETIYGADWVVAIQALGYPADAAGRHQLSKVAHELGGWRWETGGNSGETNCDGWITAVPNCH